MLNLQDFILYSGLSETDATSALKRAEGFMFSILWDVEQSEKTEVYNGNWEYTLVLKRYPLVAIDTMTFNSETATEYYPQYETWEIARTIPFPRGYNAISITYTAGWTADTIPTELKYAVYELACKIAQAGESYGSNVTSESIDWASISWWEIEKTKEEEKQPQYEY